MRKDVVTTAVYCDMCHKEITSMQKFAIVYGKDTYDLCAVCRDMTKLVTEFIRTRTSVILDIRWKDNN